MKEMDDKVPALYFGYGSNLDKDDWTAWCKERGKDPSGLKELGPHGWMNTNLFSIIIPAPGMRSANIVRVASGMAATPEHSLKSMNIH